MRARALSLAIHDLGEQAMKFRITEPTFFLHEERKPGETLEHAVGPFRYEPGAKGLTRTAQFEEITMSDALQNPFDGSKPMSITGFKPGSIRAALDAAKSKAEAELTEAMGSLAEAQTKAAEVPAAIKQVADQIKKEAADALAEFAQFTNGGPA